MTNDSAQRIGRGLVLLVAAVLLLDGIAQVISPPMMVDALRHIGFPPDWGPRLAVLTLSCAVLLAVPATRPFGALLTTAFLGGAICSHVRIGEFGSPPQLICIAIGVLMWGGLVLSDGRVRAWLTAR
jgi:uncharacterized membrane protein YphA (DoxX/SURF4 family)